MIAISMGLLRLIVWRERLIEADYPPEEKVRGGQTWSILLVILLVASGCAYYAVRMF